MCSRYFFSIETIDDEFRKIIRRLNRCPSTKIPAIKMDGEVFPTDTVPALVPGGADRCTPIAARWGFTLPDSARPIINARVETIDVKPLFKYASPCLIPATNYFEWSAAAPEAAQLAFDGFEAQMTTPRTTKVKHAIAPCGKPGLFFMAGLTRHEAHMPSPSFTIVTREASPSLRHIHSRMPAMLSMRDALLWLTGDRRALPWIETAVAFCRE